MRNWLLIDANYLCHRAKHSTGGLSFGGLGTGVAYGVLRDVLALSETHNADRVIFGFDSRASHRKALLPSYKSSRKEGLTEQDLEDLKVFYAEIQRLQHDLLPRAGFRNVFEVEGYEADDIIAGTVETMPEDVFAVIVSADQDLYQCIGKRAVMYNPSSKKTITLRSFILEWGIEPKDWVKVKCLAGCGTDDIEGIRGIGEKSAAGYFSGDLKKENKKWKIIDLNMDILETNMPLVRVPFPGLVLPEIVPDEVSESKLLQVQQDLGIRSRVSARAAAKSKEMAGGFDV